MDIAGSSALVVGGAGGLGEATVRRLHAAGAKVVVAGHLHVRTTDWIDGVRFEEVSLGYPRHWRRQRGIDGYLREILPGPATRSPTGGPVLHW